MPRVTACSTLTFALSSLQTALEHIARYGFDRVEIADMLPHTKHFSAHSSRTVDPVAVRELLKRNGLTAIAANCALKRLEPNSQIGTCSPAPGTARTACCDAATLK